MLKVHLCKDCIEMLKEESPYVVPIEIEEVPLEQCDNYTVDGKFVNLSERDELFSD